jgi:hypothetical protein
MPPLLPPPSAGREVEIPDYDTAHLCGRAGSCQLVFKYRDAVATAWSHFSRKVKRNCVVESAGEVNRFILEAAINTDDERISTSYSALAICLDFWTIRQFGNPHLATYYPDLDKRIDYPRLYVFNSQFWNLIHNDWDTICGPNLVARRPKFCDPAQSTRIELPASQKERH